MFPSVNASRLYLYEVIDKYCRTNYVTNGRINCTFIVKHRKRRLCHNTISFDCIPHYFLSIQK